MAYTFPRRTFTLLAAALVSVGALAACGHGPMGRAGDDAGMAMMMGGPGGAHRHGPRSDADMQKMRERMIDRATQELALDEAQKQRLVKLMDTMHAQRQQIMGGARGPGQGPRAELQVLIAGDKFDRSKAQALADAKVQAIRGGSPELIAAAGDFFDSLKPEQQAKVREYMARGGRGGHHGMRGGPRG